jgi:hypothetical protein
MKKLLSLTLVLALASFTTAALADDVTIALKKASDTKAKVTKFSNGKTLETVPISFASDASWDNVKDSYDISSDTASELAAKKASISVASDGTLTFSKKK